MVRKNPEWYIDAIADAILYCKPNSSDKNDFGNAAVFKFIQVLKAIDMHLIRYYSRKNMKEIVRLWWEECHEFIVDKSGKHLSFEETSSAFFCTWLRVKYPKGGELAIAVARARKRSDLPQEAVPFNYDKNIQTLVKVLTCLAI